MITNYRLEKEGKGFNLYMKGYESTYLATFQDRKFALYVMNKLNEEKSTPILKSMRVKK